MTADKTKRVLLEEDVPFHSARDKKSLSLKEYRGRGGYEAWVKALTRMKPDAVLSEVKNSGLRGRGGAGYPTWKKWEIVAGKEVPQKVLCCNGAEEEPGTFKDQILLRVNPHQFLEGALIAAYTVGAAQVILYINQKFTAEIKGLKEGLREIKALGFWGENILGTGITIDITLFESPVAYVAGEETAMLEVLEGRRPAPRQKPPFYPVHNGLYGKPTLVNNVETLSNIPHIIQNGSVWYKEAGTPESTGTALFTLTGDINQPGVYELPMGTPLRRLIEVQGKGIKGGGKLKAVFPGGPSCGVIAEKDIDVTLDYESLKNRGTAFGTGAVIVFDETACLVNAGLRIAEFFAEESCGQCPPCKMGGRHLADLHHKIESGKGEIEDLRSMEQICGVVKGRGYCSLITGASVTVESMVRNFRAEYEEHIKSGGCRLKEAKILRHLS
ncbi:MAG: SLBB domain-containing protein [Nitrospirae bacterium]|nr:SLBB domain-containing protein [Nitrospirota bacterium]MBI3604581.1 SLBB domain-containing protein [Nitrospirota bacterium]